MSAQTLPSTLALASILSALALAPAAGAPAPQFPDDAADTVRLQLLAVNDFHGALEPRTLGDRPVGGAAALAAYLDRHEQEAAAEGVPTIRVGSGDLIGGSPPSSALLQDEPTIRALSLMNLRYSAVGNHELDEGLAELRRLQDGGCHPITGCFEGAGFRYLAANILDVASGQPVFPPYALEEVGGVRVAFIGALLEETPSIVAPSAVAGLRFLDEAEAVNAYVAELGDQGIEAFVVLLHQGGTLGRDGQLNGEIVPIVEALDGRVDVVASGHSHRGYIAYQAGKLVTQAFSSGSAFADIDLTLDRRTGDVVRKRAGLVTAWADVEPGASPHPEVAAIVAAAAEQARPFVAEVVGEAAADVRAAPNAAGESALGSLIADAQRRAMGSQVALTNPGGIRADLAAGPVTWGDLFTIQPFGNDLVRMTLSGAQLEQLLEQQWLLPDRPRVLQVSGLRYTWRPSAPPGERVDPAEIFVDGRPLDPAASYTVTMNSFLAEGGDGFLTPTEAASHAVGPTDLDALVEHVRSLPRPFSASTDGRITTR